MNKIYITSDLPLGHDKDFVVAERGFNTVCEHDAAIKNNWNGLIDEAHPYMYHVGLDSHNMMPVLLDDVIEEVRQEKNNYDGLHKDE